MPSQSSPSPVTSTTSRAPELESQQTIPAQKPTVLSRIKSFTNVFNSKKSKEPIIFPPPSWFITDEESSLSNTSDVDSAGPVASENHETPDPSTLAQRIKALIDSLPLPAALTPASTSSERNTATKLEDPGHDDLIVISKDDKGPPVPTGVDVRLMRLLSSEDVMNGDVGDGGKNGNSEESRQSVWSMLERLRHGRSTLGKKANSDDMGEGVMMYSPLEPKSDSQVEIAESELEYIDLEDFRSGKFVDEDQANGKGQEEATPPAVPNQPVLEKIWVPSTTSLSLYTTWWGYRLYLPPPVMSTLGNNQLKATKRAAMITAALQWFLNKIPLTMMPPQVRGAAVLLRRLLPLVGYIGVFIAWSWTRISARDKGNGVVLTATWLLPVALIPMAWDAGTIHGPFMPRPPKDGEEATVKSNNTAYTDENKGGSKTKKPGK